MPKNVLVVKSAAVQSEFELALAKFAADVAVTHGPAVAVAYLALRTQEVAVMQAQRIPDASWGEQNEALLSLAIDGTENL